jgi:uncharacterized protein with PIN domain
MQDAQGGSGYACAHAGEAIAGAQAFGDCMSYAAAVALDASLLFKGEDFARTNVRRAEI